MQKYDNYFIDLWVVVFLSSHKPRTHANPLFLETGIVNYTKNQHYRKINAR